MTIYKLDKETEGDHTQIQAQ